MGDRLQILTLFMIFVSVSVLVLKIWNENNLYVFGKVGSKYGKI